MASNFNGDSEDGSSQDSLKPPPRSKSRTKSLDELVAKLEEQNRWVDWPGVWVHFRFLFVCTDIKTCDTKANTCHWSEHCPYAPMLPTIDRQDWNSKIHGENVVVVVFLNSVQTWEGFKSLLSLLLLWPVHVSLLLLRLDFVPWYRKQCFCNA